jgi:hypothetical protein
MVVFPHTGVVQDFVTTTLSFVISEEVRGMVTKGIIGEA